MKTETRIRIVALVIFVLLSLLHLYPLSFHPRDSVHDPGDPLLNTWIISTVQKNLLSRPGKLFDGNIFYPSEKTIAFSEHLFPQSLISLPLTAVFKNPLLIYNILFLFSYVLTAYAMFIFVRFLTGDFRAGLVSGVIFAFSAYHLDHIPQLQLLSSGLFVFCIHYLIRYFKDQKTKHSLLFSLFFLLQALACVYYALFLISVLMLVIPLLLFSHWKQISKSFILKMAVPLLAASGVLLVFTYPYTTLLKFYGFSRDLAVGADLGNYFGVPKNNVLLGHILSPLGKPEGFFFPGFTACLLAGIYIFKRRRFSHSLPTLLRWFFCAVLSASFLTMLVIIAAGGFNLKIGTIQISANNLPKPALALLLSAIVFIMLSFALSLFRGQAVEKEKFGFFYLSVLILLWALFLSFGKTFSVLGQTETRIPLPFTWFYSLVPGFSGVRAPSRYGVFVLFAVAAMAGYGFHLLLTKIRKQKAAILALTAAMIVINMEYLSIPQRIRPVPVKEDIPPTYFWLQQKKENFALLEYPFFDRIGWESVYMYFSLSHRKNIVNGYSGFIPPSYFFLREAFASFPSPLTVGILKDLDVKYVVVHPKMMDRQMAARMMDDIENKFADDLRLEKTFVYSFKKPWEYEDRFGEEIVLRVIPDPPEQKTGQDATVKSIPDPDWTIKSNMNRDLLPLLKDDRLDTRWSTNHFKRTGDYLLIEFSRPMDYPLLSLSLGPSVNDFAIDFKVETSPDGRLWQPVEDGYLRAEFLERLFRTPTDIVQKVWIRQRDIMSVKITQVGNSEKFFWSVADLDISQANPGIR